MNLFSCLSALSVIVALPLALLAATSEEPVWSLVSQDDGIRVYEKSVPGSGLLAFRGETVVDASVGEVFFVLDDAEHEEEWVDMLVVNEVLEKFSPGEKIQYQSFDLPWPISDRDFVYRAKVSVNPKTRALHFDMASTEHSKAPETTGVRALIFESAFVLTPRPDGRTHVRVEIHSDPRGSIPTWLVNLIQEDWPTDTLKGIRRQVKKPFVHPLPMPRSAEWGGE